jgi:hypothetical protein
MLFSSCFLIKPTFNAKNQDVWELNPASCIKKNAEVIETKFCSKILFTWYTRVLKCWG